MDALSCTSLILGAIYLIVLVVLVTTETLQTQATAM